MRKFQMLFWLLVFSTCIFAKEEIPATKKPLKAAAYSFIVPGGGQFYNQKYIKSGFIFALESSLLGISIHHQLRSDHYYEKYKSTENEDYYNKYLDYYYKKQNDLWWLGTVIFLSTIDAFVDAHLFDFEKTKDRIHLKFEENTLSLSYRF